MNRAAAEITFDHVTKRYAGRDAAAVDDLSLEIPAGAFCVLVGPSGGGKTTALKMVNRLIPMTDGDITIFDLLWRCRLDRFSRLLIDSEVGRIRLSGVIVGKVDVNEFRDSTFLDHAVEVANKLQSSSLVRDVKIVARIIGIQVWLTVFVLVSENRQHR